MIVPDQQNLKIHFAAVENIDQFVSAAAVNVNYMLFTCFNLICAKVGIKHITMNYNVPLTKIPNLVELETRHSIMDSGLFTLMFGSHKGQKDEQFLDRWVQNLIEFVQESGYRGSCVDVDCQKILGVPQAWKYRKMLRDQLPHNRIINVFHKEDGQKGLDELIEFSDYIAISVPELRIMKKKHYTEYLCHYIKNKKPEIDIHLLGCTERKMLKSLNFCSSSDSSSWTGCVRYGHIDTLQGKFKMERFHSSSLLNRYIERVHVIQKKYGINLPNDKRTATLAFACEQLKNIYAAEAGGQN